MELSPNSWAARHFRPHPATLLLLAGILAGSLNGPADLQAETISATARASADEGWGRVPQPWDDPASTLVGDTGDPELIEFEGNKTFATKVIREQLMMSAGYLLGSHHLARREPFLAMLREKIRAGYQNSGFPEPQVEVRYDKEKRRARVVIVEGRRFRCGEVFVEGVAPEVAKTVIERLTIRPEAQFNFNQPGADKVESGVKARVYAEVQPGLEADPSRPFSQEGEQKTFWETGEPVSFVEAYQLELAKIARKALAQHGLFFPKLELSIQAAAGKPTAALLIKVTDPGPAAVIGEIVIEGGRKNSKADILQFLGLKPGMAITRATLDEAERKLWNSGRFRHYELEPVLTPAENPASRHLRLVIRVAEFEQVPKLTEELSPKQKVLLLLGRYVAGMSDRGEEIVIRAGSGELLPFEMTGLAVLAPSKGLLVRLADPQSGTGGYAYSLQIAETTFGFYNHLRGSKLLVKDTEMCLRAFLRLLPTMPEETNSVNLSMGAGFSSLEKNDKQHRKGMDFEFTIAPAALVKDASDLEGEPVLANNQWTITGSNMVLRIDARSGRLEEFRWASTEPDKTTNHLSVALTNRAFEAACRELETETESVTNYYSPSHPTSSSVRFLAGEALRLGLGSLATNLPAAKRELLATSFERLLGSALLDLDGQPPGGEEAEALILPLDETDIAVAQNSILALYSGLVFRYCSDWFPKYSWPWTLARESVLVLASKGAYADGEMERLSRSEDTGPIGSLAIAYLLGQINPAAGRSFATRGLTRLSATDFKADCRLFLEGDSGLAKACAGIAASLRKMPEDEVEALAASLPTAESALLRDSARALREAPERPLFEALSPALGAYWNTSLRGIIRAKLLNLSIKLQNSPRPRSDS